MGFLHGSLVAWFLSLCSASESQRSGLLAGFVTSLALECLAVCVCVCVIPSVSYEDCVCVFVCVAFLMETGMASGLTTALCLLHNNNFFWCLFECVL